MGLRTETRTIDGLDVTTTQLPAMRASVLFAKLGRIVGPALAQLGTTNLGGLVGLVFQNLSPADVPALTQEILASTTVLLDSKAVPLGQPGMIDLVFSEQGRLPALLKVLRFSLEVNYSDFFDGGSLVDLLHEVNAASQ